jgi:ribonuclease P protein component
MLGNAIRIESSDVTGTVSLCYKKDLRIRKRKDFNYLRQHSAKVVLANCIIFYCKNANLSGKTRLGVSISAKITNSVKRNRLKRLLREAFRCSSFTNLGTDCLVALSTRKKQMILDEMETYEKFLVQDFLRGMKQMALKVG